MTERFEPLVTCIVPIYNAEKYLPEAVDSLLSQSYKNLEIILVDDHSTDSSWEMAQDYAKKHANVTALQTAKNSGTPLEGRRLGAKKAKGEWITFMDNDDYVKKDYIQHLVDGTENGKYDISVTGHSRLYEDGTIEDFKWKDYSQSTKKRLNEFYKHFIYGDYHTDPTDTIGQNLVRAEVVKKTNLDTLPNNIYAEDTMMALSFLANSKNGVNFVDHHDFVWRQLAGSGSHGGFYRRADRDAFYDACQAIFSRDEIKALIDQDAGKVSIIVPMYKVEKYVATCIESVLNQTYSNIELILVDDESPDDSGKIADEYAKKDDRITVIHKPKNQGLNMARATGFEASTGAYVMFVDSDDLIARDTVEFTVRTAVKNKAEFVKFNLLTFSDEKQLPKGLMSVDEVGDEKVISTKKDLYKTRFDTKVIGVSRITVWGGLYRRTSIKKIDWKQSNYRQHEDMHWILAFFETVNKGVFTSRAGYFYRVIGSTKTSAKALSGNLSTAISGNTLNDKPMGFLEFATDYASKLKRYNKKYDLELDDDIDKFVTWQWLDRLTKLWKANMLKAENNADYFLQAIDEVSGNYRKAREQISQKDAVVKQVRKEKDDLWREVKKLREENAKLKTKIESFNSVKRSARLLLGNTKRKIKSVIK